MKKIIYLCLILLAFLFSSQKIYAVGKGTVAAELKTEVKTIDYALPYPGFLPDNRLYFLKMLRDKIVGFLISDPVKKAEFDILTADKRLNASVYLFAKGVNKYDLAETTVSKGVNYLDEALVKIKLAKKQGMSADIILDRLEISLKKQQEIITGFKNKTTGGLRNSFDKDSGRIASLLKNVEELKSK